MDGIDPSGHDDLIETLATTYIQSSLASMVMPVISTAVNHVAAQLIPESWIQGIETSPLCAIEVGGSANFNFQAKKLPVNVSVGGEVLWSPRTHNWALYGFGGVGATFGQTGRSVTDSGNVGFVFGTPYSQDYNYGFVSLSVPFKTLTALPAALMSRVNNLLSGEMIPPSVIQGVDQYGANWSYIFDRANFQTINFFRGIGSSSFGFSVGYWPPQSGGNAGILNGVSFSTTWYYQVLPWQKNVQF